MKKSNLTRRLGAYSVAAGAAALGMAATAEAGLNVFDHRAAPLYPIVDYWTFDQTLMVMDVKTGDFQYVVDDLGGTPTSISRYDQDGFVDNNPIPETDKTNDTVWFSHRDMDLPRFDEVKPGDGVTMETPTGAAAGLITLNPTPGIAVYTGNETGVRPIEPDAVAHDWYWAEQLWDIDNDPGTADERWSLPHPSDPDDPNDPHASGHHIAVDGSLDYNDSNSTGYTGVVVHGFGGLGHGSGSDFGVLDAYAYPDTRQRSVTIGFKLEEDDGTHYGWVAMRHDWDRNRIREVYGWAYNTTPYAAAELTWVGDPSVPGDFDGDGDVDADDIDILCANMGSLDLATYDLDGSGVVDEADMIFHIETLVEYDTDGDGTPDGQGTHQGDFNLDGVVNATDLQLMKSSFGLSGVGYALGNANCDTVVNATDLQILKAKFGLVASAVPEPATLTMLVLGAGGLLARRRKR